jgi:hypothetical protein
VVGASEVGKEASELRFHCYLRDRVCRDTCLGRRWHTADLEQYMLESDEWERVVGQPSVLQLPAHGIYANKTAMSSAALHEVRVRPSEREGGSVERAGHCGSSWCRIRLALATGEAQAGEETTISPVRIWHWQSPGRYHKSFLQKALV